ncbi:MAG: hypothetical protein ACAI34_07340, partial [Verrucomicrobium sp.]
MEFTPFLMVDQVSGAEKAGVLTGGLLLLLTLIFGIVRCFQIMMRPTTSKLCVTSLLLVLVAWGWSGAVNVGMTMANLPRTSPLYVLSIIIALMIILAALVLGVVGLSIFDVRRFVQG